MKPVATMTVAAEPAERAGLARRLGQEQGGVEAIDRLTADLTLEILPGPSSHSGRRLRLSGRLQAALRQLCVVTLEPLEATIDESFTVIYAGGVADAAEVEIDDAAADDSWDEPWPGDSLDVGEAVAQQLALAIDPYPRKPGVEAPAPATAQGAARPFAALSSMVKDRQGRA
jgi:hypothetical protein